MNQVSATLRRVKGGYMHWCNACDDSHVLPDTWQFNGDINKPSFHPSFKHSGFKTVQVNGIWNGEWVRDANGNPVPEVCHYILTNGILNYQNDCTHTLKGQSVPLPPLPDWLTDDHWTVPK